MAHSTAPIDSAASAPASAAARDLNSSHGVKDQDGSADEGRILSNDLTKPGARPAACPASSDDLARWDGSEAEGQRAYRLPRDDLDDLVAEAEAAMIEADRLLAEHEAGAETASWRLMRHCHAARRPGPHPGRNNRRNTGDIGTA